MPKVMLKVRDLKSGDSSVKELPSVDAAVAWLAARPSMTEVHGVVFEGLSREENDRMRAAARPLDDAERARAAALSAAAEVEIAMRAAARDKEAEEQHRTAHDAAKNADPNRPMEVRYRFDRQELENTDAHDERAVTDDARQAVLAWVHERTEWVTGRGQIIGEAKVVVYPGTVPARAERIVSGTFVPVSAPPAGNA
jgi:hypothetical protein